MAAEGLRYSEILKSTVGHAELRGLEVEGTVRDEALFVTIRRRQKLSSVTSRDKVTFWTSGTGAFVSDFDDQWYRVVTEYTPDDQADAVREIVEVAESYLQGDGEEFIKKSKWRRQKRFLSLRIYGELVILQESRSRQRP